MFIKILRNIFFVTICLLTFSLLAQTEKEYYFENISIPEGLSNTQVWDMVQDKYGFLWIATMDGLNRYDGYNIKVFKNDPEDRNSIPNNKVQGLLIDKNDNLVIGTESGLAKYNKVSEKFTTILIDSSLANSPSNNIFKIYQDSKDRIWLGTSSGIFLYDVDKNKFTLANLKGEDKAVPSSGTVFAFLETSSGDIYSGYLFTGLIKFNENEKLFEKISIDPSNEDLLNGNLIFDLVEDKTGKLWISNNIGLFTYDPHSLGYAKVKLFESEKAANNNSTVTDIYQDENGYLWISTAVQGMYRYNLKTNNILKLKQASYPRGISANDPFFKFFMDDFGILWVPTFGKGLLKLDFQKEPFRLFPIPEANDGSTLNSSIISILKNNANSDLVWLGTNDGLYKYRLSDKSFEKYSNIIGDARSLPSNNVYSIVSVNDNDLWLGTGNGLSYYDFENNRFINYNLIDSTAHYKSDYNFIRNIAMDDYGNLWLATGNGLVKYDTKTKTKLFIKEKGLKTYSIELLSYIDSLHKNNLSISSILEVGDFQNLSQDFEIKEKTNVLAVSVGEGIGGMWDYGWVTNSENDTLFIHKKSTEVFNYLSGNAKNRIFAKTLTLETGKYKLNYVSDDSHSFGKWNTEAPIDSAWWGIQLFVIPDQDIDNVNQWLTKTEKEEGLQGTAAIVVKYQKDGSLLIGTNEGISKYYISQNKIENYSYPSNILPNANTNQVNDIFVENDGITWIATMGGLIRFDQKTNEYNILYDKNGLPSNYLQAIEEDNYGNLWISTLNGITKFNKDITNPIFINFDVKDGLQSYTFTLGSSFKSENGELFFGGINGFNAFLSGNINNQLPKINIAEMKINNKTVLPNDENSPLTENILDTKDIVLDYSQNNVSFDFNSIHFSRPEKNQNAYVLEGFDEEGWIYTDRKFASYTNLPEGEYVFKVKGANGDGIWNESGTSINIKVLPPLWRTIWAYILYAFILALGVFLVNNFQKRRLLAKAKEKMKIQEAEHRAEAAELQARAIEAESERKTKELEEARELQLSMLPKNLPQLPHLDIAVYMQTATEVGGDYYDFHVGLDGTLTVVLGDATGHGMKAGTMVTSTKSLFNALVHNPNIIETFHEMTRCLKLMQLEKLSMCMTMMKIIGNKVQMSAAGMPPVLHYKRENQSMDELVMKGMPLGTFDDFPYTLKESELNSGDTLLLVSDGLPELFNKNKEMFTYKRMRNLFEETANENAEEIIKTLKNAGSDWADGKDPDDDVTFVVIKVK